MATPTVETSKWATLRNGRRVIIRPIRPTDSSALVAFHEGLTEDSKRLRFFSYHPHLASEEVARFVEVDHQDREALVALSLDSIVGVGRFDRVGLASAEVAFSVSDDWQGLGLASLLLQRLAARAATVGITQLEADTLGENHHMLAVFARWAPAKKLSFDHGIVHVEMPISGSGEAFSRS